MCSALKDEAIGLHQLENMKLPQVHIPGAEQKSDLIQESFGLMFSMWCQYSITPPDALIKSAGSTGSSK